MKLEERRTVSVIVPAHNEEKSIGRAIDAIRSQSRPGVTVEIIVADDGSTDRTVEQARAAGAQVVEAPTGAGGIPPLRATAEHSRQPETRWSSSTPTARRARGGWRPFWPHTTAGSPSWVALSTCPRASRSKPAATTTAVGT